MKTGLLPLLPSVSARDGGEARVEVEVIMGISWPVARVATKGPGPAGRDAWGVRPPCQESGLDSRDLAGDGRAVKRVAKGRRCDVGVVTATREVGTATAADPLPDRVTRP